MKVINIKCIDDTYIVTKKPNLVQRLFGFKEKTEKYKNSGSVFFFDRNKYIFYKSDGTLLSLNNKMCNILNKYVHSF